MTDIAIVDAEDEIYRAMCDSMPYGELIVQAIYRGHRDNAFTILPSGSHIVLTDERGQCRGADVVAMQQINGDTKVVSNRGDTIRLGKDRFDGHMTTLVIGKK